MLEVNRGKNFQICLGDKERLKGYIVKDHGEGRIEYASGFLAADLIWLLMHEGKHTKQEVLDFMEFCIDEIEGQKDHYHA